MFILNLLAFKYEINSLAINKPNVMLFDEPDKSWDPDYIRLFFKIIYEDFYKKNNIQIILTTHRTDTIKLASIYNDPSIGIFSLKKTGVVNKIQILPCHPLLATFRLTNDRELINVKSKVYVESLKDSYFYNKYYEFVCKICQELRNSRKKSILNNRLMSRRYQLEFFSCSINKNSGGGCDKVIESIKRDKNSIEYGSCITSNLIPSKLKAPFALLDLDYKNHLSKSSISITQKVKKENLEGEIVILKRHSLENFSFDPLLLLFNHKALVNDLIEKCPKSSFKNICKNCFKTSPLEFFDLKKSKKTFDVYFEFILKNVMESDTNNSQHIQQVYNILCSENFLTSEAEFPIEGTKKSKLDFLDTVLRNQGKTINNNRYNVLINIKKNIHYFSNELDKSGLPKVIKFDYPVIFLYLKGHTIVNNFIKLLYYGKVEKDIQSVTQAFEDSIYNSNVSNLNLMPMDLLESFDDLNKRNVKKGNTIIKSVADVNYICEINSHKQIAQNNMMEIDQDKLRDLKV